MKLDGENVVIGLAIAAGLYLAYKNFLSPQIQTAEQNAGVQQTIGAENYLEGQAAGIGDDFLSFVGNFADDQ
jgi:hypothetical protein